MKKYVCPYCHGRGGYYKSTYCDGALFGKKYEVCPQYKNGIIEEEL